MNLRRQAAADLLSIMSDSGGGFGWSITITTPLGQTAVLTGLTNDISEAIDPLTGMLVSERRASIAIPLAALVDAGITAVPTAVASASSKPWIVTFRDILGNSHTFAVKNSSPDLTIGAVTCQLEIYRGPA